MKQNTSRVLAVALALVLICSAAGVGSAARSNSTSVFDKRTIQHATIFGFDEPSTAVSNNDTLRWSVQFDDSPKAIEKWAQRSDDRQIIWKDGKSDTMVVEATAGSIGVSRVDRFLNQGLASKPSISSISLVESMSHPNPVELKPERKATHPLKGQPAMRALSNGEYSTAGIAYSDDAEVATLREARNMTGATSVSNATGDNSVVAIIDTGINTANGTIFGHESRGSDLRLMEASKNFHTNKTVQESGIEVLNDTSGHGTHVASTVAANYSNDSYDGYAPEASILGLKVFDENGSTSTAIIARSIRYAADHDADVIQMSLGTPYYDEELANAVEYAVDQGSLVIVAAGNSRSSTRWVETPSDVPQQGVVSVAAANYSAKPTNAGVGYFSALGDDPGTADLSTGASQGQNITVSGVGMRLEAIVATTDGNVTTRNMSGTSMAAPGVTGASLLAMDAHPTWENNPAYVHSQIKRSATAIPGAAYAETGHGLLNTTNLVSGRTGGDQLEARTAAARERDQLYNWIAKAAGRSLPLDREVEI